jgi:hypothetical protein
MKDEQGDPAENSGENTGADEGCPENLKPYRWKKGQPSPNPGGRPKKAPISEAYAHHVGDPLPDDIRSKLRLPKGATWADAIALGQLRAAVKGNTVAAKEIADRVEGRVPLPMEVETPEGREVRIEVVYLGDREELTNGSDEKQAVSQNHAAIEPEPGRAERKPWERPRTKDA